MGHMQENVYLKQLDTRERSVYPDKGEYFSPSEPYPEYIFSHISTVKNLIYDALRESFYAMRYDVENYGKPEWNPLGKFIEKGNCVLIKPNMVLHENHVKENGIECLITSPALVRAVVDYCLIALQGTGKIIIADAPVQSCDFEQLLDNSGYRDMKEFYERQGIDIEIEDLREYENLYSNGVEVSVDSRSKFAELSLERLRALRVTNYNPDEMEKYHNEHKNSYYIARKILEADVIINMPKPKTHRKAGVTISLKNMVGINANKAWLPHHTIETAEIQGDAYKGRNLFKRWSNNLLDCINRKEYSVIALRILQSCILNFNRLGKIFYQDPYFEGSWYGNDTIWRTIVDLNYLVRYADSIGKLQEKPQRIVLNIADMIICGEGEGPLLPKPKAIGIIALAENAVALDVIVASLMGINYKKIPSIYNATSEKLLIKKSANDIFVYSNREEWDDKTLDDFLRTSRYRFLLSDGWSSCNDIYI